MKSITDDPSLPERIGLSPGYCSVFDGKRHWQTCIAPKSSLQGLMRASCCASYTKRRRIKRRLLSELLLMLVDIS